MILSDDARAARKRIQLERLAKKADDIENYPAFYAAQGVQQAKAQINAKITAARHLERAAAERLQMAQVTGLGIESATNELRAATATKVGAIELKKIQFGGATSAALSGGTT